MPKREAVVWKRDVCWSSSGGMGKKEGKVKMLRAKNKNGGAGYS